MSKFMFAPVWICVCYTTAFTTEAPRITTTVSMIMFFSRFMFSTKPCLAMILKTWVFWYFIQFFIQRFYFLIKSFTFSAPNALLCASQALEASVGNDGLLGFLISPIISCISCNIFTLSLLMTHDQRSRILLR